MKFNQPSNHYARFLWRSVFSPIQIYSFQQITKTDTNFQWESLESEMFSFEENIFWSV